MEKSIEGHNVRLQKVLDEAKRIIHFSKEKMQLTKNDVNYLE